MAKAPESNATGAASSSDGPSGIEQYLVKDPERFALNMARMIEQAGKAAAAWAEPREKGEVHDTLAEPAADMVRTFSKLTEYWLSDPARALEAQSKLYSGYISAWSSAVARAQAPEKPGAVEPERGDKRFQDPEWGRNAFFDLMKQTYLVTSRWAQDLVLHADGLDEQTRHKAEFYMRQLVSALSPSNFVLTNPELFRETVSNHGENLARGMKMLAEDIGAGKGELRLRQVDTSAFELGRNIAMTPGKVVARSDVAEVIHYQPLTEKVLKRPLLICPPWINKFYILDLNPQKSFVHWALEQGHAVFVISWVNPDERHRDKDWEAYIREGLQFALDTIEQTTGQKEVNAIGYCVGGTLLAAGLALMAQEGDKRIRSATFFATQVDFTYSGDLKVLINEEQFAALERSMGEKGYLEGTRMATAFNLLRAQDLIWPYVVNNYMRGKEPLPFDLLYWNADCTRMTAANHAFYLRNCYLDNNLSQGRMEIAGRKLSLRDIKIPIYNLGTKDDHIAPALSVFTGSQFFGGPVEFLVSGSGHIAGVINPPALKKYQYWTGGKPEGSLDDWMARAEPHAGSWWPHWQDWILRRDRRRVAAQEPGSRIPVLGDAPGTYVMERV